MRLAVQRVGQGPRPVVLLHGFLGSGRNLAQLARKWAEADPSRTLLLPDLTGHGTSPALPEGADLRTMATDVLETARAEGVSGPVSFVGHSLGGRVALTARLVAPAEVADVTLIDIGPTPLHGHADEGGRTSRALLQVADTFATRDEARAALASHGLERGIVEWLLTNLVPSGERYAWRFDRHALAAFRTHVTDTDLWPAITRDGTTRVIRGARSPYVNLDELVRLQQANVEVDTVPDAGHFVHVDNLPALLALLLR